MFTHEPHTHIDIAAPPDIVWAHLVEVGAYPDWNPFITSLTAPVRLGARLSVRMEPPDSRPSTFRPRVTELTDGRLLEWRGHLAVPALFDARHRFELTPKGSSTQFVQAETLSARAAHGLRSRFSPTLVPGEGEADE